MGWSVAASVALAASGCGSPPTGEEDGEAGPSPNASIIPAPLASVPAASTQGALVPTIPSTFEEPSAPLPLPMLSELTAETNPRETLPAVVMTAKVFVESEFGPPSEKEVEGAAIETARVDVAPRLEIALAPEGRLAIRLLGKGWHLAERSELRARDDRTGHVLLWPNASDYRVAAVGTLRALLGEGRMDVTPTEQAEAALVGEGRRLELDVEQRSYETSYGKALIDVARIPEAGQGGPLLCRTLLELLGVGPEPEPCDETEVPLSARFAWPNDVTLRFEVESMERDVVLEPGTFAMPPSGAEFRESGLPLLGDGNVLSRQRLASFRAEAIPVPTDPEAPADGIRAVNVSDRTMMLQVDGVTVGIVPAAAERTLEGFRPGRYRYRWRSFLGDELTSPADVTVPARLQFGVAPVVEPGG